MLSFDEIKIKAGLIIVVPLEKIFAFELSFQSHVKYLSSHVVVAILFSTAQARVETDCVLLLLHFYC